MKDDDHTALSVRPPSRFSTPLARHVVRHLRRRCSRALDYRISAFVTYPVPRPPARIMSRPLEHTEPRPLGSSTAAETTDRCEPLRPRASKTMGDYCAVEIVTLLFSSSMSMSGFFQNNLLLRKACNGTVPFGECAEGEAHAQHVVSVIYSWKAVIQYTVPVMMIILAGEHRRTHVFVAGVVPFIAPQVDCDEHYSRFRISNPCYHRYFIISD